MNLTSESFLKKQILWLDKKSKINMFEMDHRI